MAGLGWLIAIASIADPSANVPAQEANTPAALVAAEAKSDDIHIVAQRTTASQVPLRSGFTVRPPDQQRTTIVITGSSWDVDADNLRFERIDFVWEPGSAVVSRPGAAAPSMIVFRGRRAAFDDCTWRSGDNPAVAIEWIADASRASTPAHLQFTRCIFYQVQAAIGGQFGGLATIECSDTLHLGPGPLVELAALPAAGEKLALILDHVTHRGAGGLISVSDELGYGDFGRIAIHATESVFAPPGQTALATIATRREPPEWIHAVCWTGQGNIVAGESPLLAWIDASGHRHIVAEDRIRASGLVRGSVQFAGGEPGQFASSRVVKWSAPLKTPSSPGISARHEPRLPTIIPASSSE